MKNTLMKLVSALALVAPLLVLMAPLQTALGAEISANEPAAKTSPDWKPRWELVSLFHTVPSVLTPLSETDVKITANAGYNSLGLFMHGAEPGTAYWAAKGKLIRDVYKAEGKELLGISAVAGSDPAADALSADEKVRAGAVVSAKGLFERVRAVVPDRSIPVDLHSPWFPSWNNHYVDSSGAILTGQEFSDTLADAKKAGLPHIRKIGALAKRYNLFVLDEPVTHFERGGNNSSIDGVKYVVQAGHPNIGHCRDESHALVDGTGNKDDEEAWILIIQHKLKLRIHASTADRGLFEKSEVAGRLDRTFGVIQGAKLEGHDWGDDLTVAVEIFDSACAEIAGVLKITRPPFPSDPKARQKIIQDALAICKDCWNNVSPESLARGRRLAKEAIRRRG